MLGSEMIKLNKSLDVLINIGETLVNKCLDRKDINGFGKLLKNCKAELNYLKKLSEKGKFSEAVLKSSNLSNLQGIALCAEYLPDVVAVLRSMQDTNSQHPINIDVVCNGGRTWVKVITKNSKALLANVNEQCHFGTKSIKEQAARYLEFSRSHLFQFKVPEVMFIFFHPVPQKMEDLLNQLGINICKSEEIIPKEVLSSELCLNVFKRLKISLKSGDDFEHLEGSDFVNDDDDDDDEDEDDDEEQEEEDDDDEDEDEEDDDYSDEDFDKKDECFEAQSKSSTESSLPEFPELIATEEFLESICADATCVCKSYIKQASAESLTNLSSVRRVNLDVTSMIAIVSSLCHGNCCYAFKENYLTLQAEDERSSPTLPKVYGLLMNKAIFSCQTAVDDFKKIVQVVGGPDEKSRADALLRGVCIVPNCHDFHDLQESARINSRMKTIFGTGDRLKAVTSTANNGFVRASRQAGVDFVAFVHSARALTQQKEGSATELERLGVK